MDADMAASLRPSRRFSSCLFPQRPKSAGPHFPETKHLEEDKKGNTTATIS